MAIAVLAFAVLLAVAVAFDFAEHWYGLAVTYERYELDEWPVAFTLLAVAFGWFAWRRWHDFESEAAENAAARQSLQEELQRRLLIEESLKEAQHRAEAADRAKSEFLANMSHELRTPLNATIGFAELMAQEVRGPLGDPRYREYVDNIKESGEHLLSLINEILDLSKIEAGKLELDDETFDLALAAAAALRLVTPQAQKMRLLLRSNLPKEPLLLRGDSRAVKQIISNLLSNACKFSEAGGSVELEVALNASGRCVIKVRDHGIGMTLEEINLALTPFGQVNSYISGNRKGTGLGLPLAKTLTELHGGRLTIESTPHKGTEICVILPAERVVAKHPPGGRVTTLQRVAS